MIPLTQKQQDAITRLSQYAGQRILILTTQYGDYRNIGHKGYINSSTLRGLAAKGLIQIEPIWRGAWVTVPAQINASAE